MTDYEEQLRLKKPTMAQRYGPGKDRGFARMTTQMARRNTMLGTKDENMQEERHIIDNLKRSRTILKFPYAELSLMSGTMPKAIKYIDHDAIAREFIEVFSFIYDYHTSRLNNHTR
jgi:hypothetical protein